jgi:hypothetical protein
MKNSKFILLAASFVFATALIISCSSDNEEHGSGGGGDVNGGGGHNTTYTLDVDASPYGAGTVTRNPAQAAYDRGARVTVTATPASGYAFSNWRGASNSTSNPVTITINDNETLTAVFTQTANAVIITLRYWETKETDGLFGTDKDLDPKISFNVIARQGGKTVSNNSTGALLNRDNVGQTWSGSARSSAIPFISSADELRIEAVVIEKDPLADDDISPGYYSVFKPPFVSASGTATLDYGSGKSKVRYDYEFVWR